MSCKQWTNLYWGKRLYPPPPPSPTKPSMSNRIKTSLWNMVCACNFVLCITFSEWRSKVSSKQKCCPSLQVTVLGYFFLVEGILLSNEVGDKCMRFKINLRSLNSITITLMGVDFSAVLLLLGGWWIDHPNNKINRHQVITLLKMWT